MGGQSLRTVRAHVAAVVHAEVAAVVPSNSDAAVVVLHVHLAVIVAGVMVQMDSTCRRWMGGGASECERRSGEEGAIPRA